ncbi:hypothetical protein PAXINDRAFT_98173 [Paxillus involutus ATCC 200175]|nr:hypothetical protein PAXINDRAFT_98173 [Paxillus involutus ATCC 200175]
MLRHNPHPTAHFTFSPKMNPSDSTVQGLPHYRGVNPKYYALDGAIPDVYLLPAVPLTQNQSGVESSATQSVARPDKARHSAVGLYQDPAVRADLAAASPPSALPGTLETTRHDCEAQFACGWLSESGQSVCGKPFSCKTAPDHFKEHGITKKNKKDEIPCNWEGCRIKRRCMDFNSRDNRHRRSNFIRHICESHIKHPRRVGRLSAQLFTT